MQDITVFFDLDNTLLATSKAICKLAGLDYNDQKLRNGCKDNYYFLDEFVGRDKMEKMLADAGEELWENLELLPWGLDLYNLTCDLVGKENVFFLTSMGFFDKASNPKFRTVKKYFNSTQIIITHFKYFLAAPGRILIDDKPKNIDLFNKHGGVGVLFPCPFFFLDGDFSMEIFKGKLADKINNLKLS